MIQNKRSEHRVKSKPSPTKLRLVNSPTEEEEAAEVDPNFQSELTYDGYRTIEEYDNDVYNSDVERDEDSQKPLVIQDREDDSEMDEEDPLDPQDNRD